MPDTRAAAHSLLRGGYQIVLCPAGSKVPLGRDWQTKKRTHAEIDRAFKASGKLNVGVRLGPQSGLIDIEDDSEEDRAALLELFDGELPPVTPVFKSKRGQHRLFAWDDRLEQVGKAVVDFQGLEIRIGAGGKGAQSLFPPSITNGVERKWVMHLDECNPAPLPDAVVQKIIEASRPAAILGTTPGVVSGGGPSVGPGVGHRGHSPWLVSTVSTVSSVSRETIDAEALQQVRDAIDATLPTSHGYRNRCIFNFARRLKAITALIDAPLDILRPFVECWHLAAKPKIATQAFEDTWFDFRHAWASVRYPAGNGLIGQLLEVAMAQSVPDCAATYEEPKIRMLVALCRELQRAAGDKTFFLACRSAAEQLGVDYRLANRWIRLLCMDEVLTLTERGRPHRASEFRYLGDM